MSVVQLTEQPKTSEIYTSAALGALPFLGSKSTTAPSTVYELRGLRVDPDNLAAYSRATGLRFGDTLPVTYPFTLVFPTVMKLMVSKAFPFAAIGSVHAENVIEQYRAISSSEPLDIRVHAENLREHRKGLLIDVISEVSVGRELVWKQTSSFLSLQKTSLSGGPREAPPADEVPPPPTRTLRVDQKTISKYAAVSGDRNPIHVSSLGAKAFGFPRTIAHGMWSAAAVLQVIEGRIPDKVTYNVRFGKPIVLPATVNLYAESVGAGWDLSLKNPKKGYPHLTATLR
ncbi:MULTISPECIES: MaoC/PaaZ C-terminal domain-containing protein [Nocardiaceae]|jgi:acyl dehydratase|uniref:MaoC/PaaZ C-terminal domain-containing protein n=1 Tax=Nocardiaceae TaxID=85025 RepID=UPI000559DB7A|nr:MULTISPECIES: MaoC/PaaZ C-terminal domain-containing protein [Rhodococcus]OZF03302.1 dehydratase [Rhodococcus sp. 15-1189-1-1a]OZF17105.1 dehydratase [Rhodococcus sp. 14-2686-1-2]OZF54649.1 dehydratase [Rhodococcus sp. 14-2470-1b]